MKKTVIIILAILPIFLIITISFAARIISTYQHIPVEKVRFTDSNFVEYDKDFDFILNVGEEKQTYIKVYPDLASNKNVEYSSNDEKICTIDENGVVKGIKNGGTTVEVKTEDGGKTATLSVLVKQEKVTGVFLPYDEIELTVGESVSLCATVEPYSAKNKIVEYKSSNSNVASVDPKGNVVATGVGEAIIYVKTLDGGFTDSCKIISKSGKPALKFNLPNNADFVHAEDLIIVNIKELNLLNYLEYDEERVIIEEIQFDVASGENRVTIDGSKLIFKKAGYVRIVAKYGDYQTELKLMINEQIFE